jgi:transcriptional regulator GlxA family with amidase domain
MSHDCLSEVPLHFGFLLVPNFTVIGFASAIEPLRFANMASGSILYRTFTITTDGQPVAGSNGVRVLPDHCLDDSPDLDALFVCGPNPLPQAVDKSILNWLRKLAHRGTALGGVCTGSYLLARAGLLNGYRCTIHWEDSQSLVETFPKMIVSTRLFEIDRDRYTCSGGVAPVDMMLNLIDGHAKGGELAAAVSELLVCERIRGADDRQRVPLRHQLGTGQPKLTEAVALMEANLEEPLGIDEVARHVGLSRRQLERLFHDHLNSSPTSYYMKLRLHYARQLLLGTDRPLLEVAAACGFVSSTHFATRYRDFFDISPTRQRRAHRLRAPA